MASDDKKTFIRNKIRELNTPNNKLVIATDIYYFLDGIIIDSTDDDVVKILAKFNTSALTDVEPTFGSIQHSSGLQEVIIPYEMIHSVSLLNASDSLMEKFRNTYPSFYEKYKNINKVEGCLVLPMLPGINAQLQNN